MDDVVDFHKESMPIAIVEDYKGATSVVDWTNVYTTPVKDQGICGSCW